MGENSFKNSNFDEAFGSLILIRKAKLNLFYIALLLLCGLVLFVPGVGILTEKQYLGGSVCLTFSLPIFYLAWFQFSLRRDELRVYQNGLTYNSRRNTQTCLWPEIESLTFTSGKSHNYTLSISAALEDDNGTLSAVTKRSKEMIEINENLKCGSEIVDAIRVFRTAKSSRKKKANTDGPFDRQP